MEPPATPPTPATPFSPTKAPLLQEKGIDTPATKSSTETPRPDPDAQYAKKSHMEGALTSILWGAFAPCLPVVIVTSVLLTGIFHYRIPNEYVFLPTMPAKLSNATASALHGVQQIENNGGDRAYFLYHNSFTNPAVLHMIASWTAKLIPFVTGASMALVAFLAGQRIIRATNAKTEKLPSPHQVSILINLLNGGGATPLWEYFKYRFHQHHEHLVQPLPIAFWCLTFIVVITFAIGAIDSWFGTATTALQIALVVPVTNASYSYGRILDPARCTPGTWQERTCPSNRQAICRYPCSMATWNSSGTERKGIYHAQQAAETLMTNSYSDTIFNVTKGNSTYFFLGDFYSGVNLDFAAETMAVETQCKMMTQDCTVPSTGGFTCGAYTSPSFSYSGEVGVAATDAMSSKDEAMVGIQFFADSTFANPIGFGANTTTLFATENPIHFLSWSKGFPPVDTTADEFGYMRDNGYLKNDTNGDAVFILSCTTTVHEAEYYWVNGSVAPNALEAYELADPYYGAVYSAPFSTNSALSHLALQDAAALAAYQLRPELLSNIFAQYFSRSAIAFTSGINIPQKNDKEWTRDNTYLATRVPYAPLYTLVALKAVYALFALTLAILAVFLTHPSRAQEIKERLTIDGLAAGFFEPSSAHERPVREITDLYEEHQRAPSEKKRGGFQTQKIGLLQTEQGGWLWVSVGGHEVKTQVEPLGLGIQTQSEQSSENTSADTGADVRPLSPTSPTSPTSLKSPASPRVGQGYKLVKEIT